MLGSGPAREHAHADRRLARLQRGARHPRVPRGAAPRARGARRLGVLACSTWSTAAATAAWTCCARWRRPIPRVSVLALSSRFGQQAALLAGLDHSDADAVVMLDSDLQHPPAVIPELVARHEQGFDVVYTVRENDASLPLVKRLSARAFYGLVNAISDTPDPPGRGRLPPARAAGRGGVPEAAARAHAVPARARELGRLPLERRALPAGRARRRRDEVPVRPDAPLRPRRHRLVQPGPAAGRRARGPRRAGPGARRLRAGAGRGSPAGIRSATAP